MNTVVKEKKKDKRIYQKTKRYLEKTQDPKINEKLGIINEILKINNKEKRYSYLYDLICDYLDGEFRDKNICGFDCGICKKRKNMIKKHVKKENYENGCCYGYKEGKTCEYLEPGKGCKIKNIACKTFTCFYLRKQGYRYKLENIYLSKYFFNRRQKFYMENTFFVDKPVVMKGIMKRG